MTECHRANEFLEFVQRCMNHSSDNSYSYTHNNEWITYSNSSWTQESWVDDANTSYLPSYYIAHPEHPYQHYSPPIPQENINFEDSMFQTLQEYEATIQALAFNCQSIIELGIQVDQLVNTFNGHEEHESWTQGLQEQIWEVETYCEEDNGEVCDA